MPFHLKFLYQAALIPPFRQQNKTGFRLPHAHHHQQKNQTTIFQPDQPLHHLNADSIHRIQTDSLCKLNDFFPKDTNHLYPQSHSFQDFLQEPPLLWPVQNHMNKQFPFRHHQSNRISPQLCPPKKWFLCAGHKTVTPQANIYPLKKLWQSILSFFLH